MDDQPRGKPIPEKTNLILYNPLQTKGPESILSKSCTHQTEHSGSVVLSPNCRTEPKNMVYESVI
jgi:hypothetical protein